MARDELAILAGATRALAEVSSARDAWELARTAEAARRYAQLKGLGHEAINYATGIKAKAMVLLADFVDAGQKDRTIRTADQGRPESLPDGEASVTLQALLGTETPEQAHKAVHEGRRLPGRPSGVRTELQKVLSGWGDYIFYGFANPTKDDLAAWLLGDLNEFRLWHHQQLYAKRPAGSLQRNGDGSSTFMAYRVDDLPSDFLRARVRPILEVA